MTMDLIGIERLELVNVRFGAEKIHRIGHLPRGESSETSPADIYDAIILEQGGLLMGENQLYIQLEDSIENKYESNYKL